MLKCLPKGRQGSKGRDIGDNGGGALVKSVGHCLKLSHE